MIYLMVADEVIAELSAPPFGRYDDLAARSPAPPPVTHGLYAWWQVSGALPGVPGVAHLTEPVELLYVGTAPRDAKSKSHLRKRLGNHHRAAIGSSTFRFDLTAFLWEREGWQPCWTDRPELPESDVTALADWQRRHLHVRWVECVAPWGLERDVVHAMRPPLNRDHNQCHPFYRAVGNAREVLRDTARLRPC